MLKIGAQLCIRSVIKGFSKPLVVNSLKEEAISLQTQPIRYTSFFNKLSQEQLWKGVLSVSNAGKRKGRGRKNDSRMMRNLNQGKKIGDGKIRVLWPGLNYSILGNTGISKIRKLPESEETKPAPIVTSKIRMSRKMNPLERGWSGKQIRGRKIGPPVSKHDEDFKDFQSVVIHYKMTSEMTATLGRKRRCIAFVATGNGNGLIGVGRAKTMDSKSCVNLARARAAKRLLTIDLIEKHTVNHDFFSEFGRTRITVLKKPKGYGLHCHRIIKSLCELIGIENLYAKVRGPCTPKNIVRAFIVGLLRQKTYQEIADEKKLHLVEFREECLNFPIVLASPEKCLTPAEARKDLVTFEEYIMGGRLLYNRKSKQHIWRRLPSWKTFLKRTLYKRNHRKVRNELLLKYGTFMSHLTKMYPESRPGFVRKVKESSSE